MTAPIIVWFRNDLRLADHPALTAAAERGAAVLPLYILDDATPGLLRMGGASRWWLNGSLAALHIDLASRGGGLCLRQGSAPEALATLLAETDASAIHVSRCYEPWEPELEKAVARACEAAGAAFRVFGGRLLFEPEAIVTGDGKPYRVFTPFWKACVAAGAPRLPLPHPKRLRFAEANSDGLEGLKLLPSRPDWAEGLRDTWRPGDAHALARLGTFIEDRTRELRRGSQPARHRRDIASVASSPFR